MQKIFAKKLLLFLSILIVCLQVLSLQNFIAFAQTKTCYARIVNTNVNLFRSTSGSEDPNNIFFTLPQSYFVEISYCEDENFFTARFDDIVGYVKKSEVQCVSGTPTTPFPQASFRVFIPEGVEMRSSPTQTEGLNLVCELNYLETNLKYYGAINGEEAIPHKSSLWYYCKYVKAGNIYFGYVYSAFCDLLTQIPVNTEYFEPIEEPDFSISTQAPTESQPESIDSLPSATQIIIIVAVCLPCIVIIYLLFRPTKITAKALEEANKTTKRKKKKSKYQDYYEYEEWAAFVILLTTFPKKLFSKNMFSASLLFVSKRFLLM